MAHFRNVDEAEDLAQEVFLRAFTLLERGNMTIDRIGVYDAPLVED